ncbi:MAG TPA: MaoC/PaaZ C-terminal domain-containing protein [Candidatus Acidoferrum sp.]|nr:MaoC/PaaZ C-terminal domain-containing protein [Candidatus Acidoferrum sp.]
MTERAFSSHVEIGPRRFRERLGLDFEEFAAGQVFKHRPGLTISQQDNVEEALDTLNRAMLHYDAQYAAHTEWGRPLVVSTLTVQRVIGMTGKTFGKRGRVLGFGEIALRHPVFGGDTLYAETEVRSTRDDGHPSWGRLALFTRGVNQDGALVCEISWEIEVYKRGALPFAEAGY